MNETSLLRSFLFSTDRFLGWLKKPLAFKPGFFLHQLLGLLLVFQTGTSTWTSGKHLYLRFNSHHPLFFNQFLAVSIYDLLSLVPTILSVIFLFGFYKKTKASWTFFMGFAFFGIANCCLSVFMLFFSEYVAKTFISNGSDLVSIAWIMYGAILPLLITGLLTKKKIRVMHKIQPRQLITALGLAISWMLVICLVVPLLFFAFAN